MGLEFLLPLIIPIASPILTELGKRLAQLFVNHVPSALVPNLSAGIGLALTEGLRQGGIDLFPGVDSRQMEDALAVGLGYAGTGVNQVSKLSGLSDNLKRIGKAVKFSVLLLCGAALLSGGCTGFFEKAQAIQDHPVMQDACKALPVMKECAEGMRVKLLVSDPSMANDMQSAITVIGVLQGVACPPK